MTATQIAYITLDDLKTQLGLPLSYTGDDSRLQNWIWQASAMVKNYLGNKSAYSAALDDDDEPELDSNFEPILESFTGDPVTMVRHEVRAAVVLLVGIMRYNPERLGQQYGQLPPEVANCLYALRDPQLK